MNTRIKTRLASDVSLRTEDRRLRRGACRSLPLKLIWRHQHIFSKAKIHRQNKTESVKLVWGSSFFLVGQLFQRPLLWTEHILIIYCTEIIKPSEILQHAFFSPVAVTENGLEVSSEKQLWWKAACRSSVWSQTVGVGRSSEVWRSSWSLSS